MKKTTALFLVLISFVICCTVSSAETSDVSDAYTLEGKGTQIIENVDLMQLVAEFGLTWFPCRMNAQSTEEIKVTLYTGDKNRSYSGSNSSSYKFSYLVDNPADVKTLFVETQGEWTLEFSALGAMPVLDASGTGAYITDIFLATPPCVVSIEFKNGLYGGYTYIDLYKIHSDFSISSEQWMWQDIVSEETFDYIIKPEDEVKGYFLRIACPHDTQWRISEKTEK